MSQSPERAVVEEVPKQLLRFACGGTLLARLVDKVACDKERSMTRALVVADYGLYVCHTNGRVSRFVIFSSVVQISVFGLSIMIRSLGQSDLLISLNPHRCNTSNDPQVVIDLLHRKCREACRDYKRVDAPSYTALVKECVLTLENPVEQQPEAVQVKLDGSAAVATQQLASSVVMLSKTKEREGTFKSPSAPQRTELKARIVELYKKYNPSKLDTVDALLNEFRGREAMLLNGIVMKYEGQGSSGVTLDDDVFDRPGALVEEKENRKGALPPAQSQEEEHKEFRSVEIDAPTFVNYPPASTPGAPPRSASPSVSPPQNSPPSTDSDSTRQATSTSAESFPSPEVAPLVPGVDVLTAKPAHSSPPQKRHMNEQRAALGIPPRLFTPAKSFLQDGYSGGFLPEKRGDSPRFEEVDCAPLANEPAPLPPPPPTVLYQLFSPQGTAPVESKLSPVVGRYASPEAPVVEPPAPPADSLLFLLRRPNPQQQRELSHNAVASPPVSALEMMTVASPSRSVASPQRTPTAATIVPPLEAVPPLAPLKMPVLPRDPAFSADELSRSAIGILVSSGQDPQASTGQRAVHLPTTVGFIEMLRRHAQDPELMHSFKYDLSTNVRVLELVEIFAGTDGVPMAMPRLFLEAFLLLWNERHGFFIHVTSAGTSSTIAAAPRSLFDHLQRFAASVFPPDKLDSVSIKMGRSADPSNSVALVLAREQWNAAIEGWNFAQLHPASASSSVPTSCGSSFR